MQVRWSVGVVECWMLGDRKRSFVRWCRVDSLLIYMEGIHQTKNLSAWVLPFIFFNTSNVLDFYLGCCVESNGLIAQGNTALSTRYFTLQTCKSCSTRKAPNPEEHGRNSFRSSDGISYTTQMMSTTASLERAIPSSMGEMPSWTCIFLLQRVDAPTIPLLPLYTGSI